MKRLFTLVASLFVFATVVAQTTTFTIPGVQSYTVPAGVTQLSVDAVGAKGGNNNNWPSGGYPSQGGWGGRVTCTINVTPGQVLQVYVGGQGTAGTTSIGIGGFNGGANGGGSGTTYNGGGGGGASDIRFSPYSLTDRKIVAGGGGGAGLNYSGGDREKGGNGGGLTAQTGFANNVANCGIGGSQVCCAAGQGGGAAGALGVGGAAVLTNAGGGGGGGYYGGGGGGSSWCGGGGGSSYTDAGVCTSVTHTQGFNTTGNGYVSLTTLVPTVVSAPGTLSFTAGVGATSVAQVFSLTASLMTSSPITVNTTSSRFEFSFNGSTWFSSAQTYPFTIPGFTNVPLYVRFLPLALTTYNENITISGGGLTSTVSLPVTGTGLPACSGTPTVGTASAMPMAGGSTTPFTLSVTDYTVAGNIGLQWQSSPNGVSGWTNISGASSGTYSFTGITATTFYRLVVTCGISGLTATSNVVKISLYPSACIPDYGITCNGTTPMYASIGTFTGSLGTSFSDPASTCSTEYINNTATHSVTLYEGLTYTPTLNVTTTYNTSYAAQVWIDFNGDGTFTSGETVGGQTSFSSGTPTLSINIPAGSTPGTYRMRLVGNYYACCGGLTYPSIPPCVTPTVNYGQARDYTVTILTRPVCGPPPAQPTALTGSSTLNTINGSFTPSVPASENYLVVMTTSSVPPSAPVDGVTYTAGTNALGGKIISAGPSTSFSVTGLTDNTTYWFWVYSYMTLCTGTAPAYRTVSPLSGTITTLPCGISGIKTIGTGGDYPTIAAAVTAINTLGLGPSASLEVLPSYTGETYPITISGTLLCASASRRLTIRPHSTNATTKTITASTASAMISLNGARFVDIDGRIGSTGSTKRMEFVNNNTSSLASTVEFINDASYNSVRHMTLRGAAIGTTTSGVVAFRTSTGTTGNDYNTIANCDISDGTSNPVNCIYSLGTSGRENDFDTIANCNLSNFYYNSSMATCGIWLSTATSGWAITGNRIFQTVARPYTASSAASMHGISISNTNGTGFLIKDNIVGFGNAAGTGTLTMSTSIGASFRGIVVSVGTITPTVIQNNTISGINFSTTTTTTNNCHMIEVSSGSANVTGNTIGSQTLTNAITRVISSNGAIGVRGIYVTSSTPANVALTDNTIGGFNLQGNSTTIGNSMYGIDASTTAGMTIAGNVIGSTSLANSISTSVTTTGSPVFYGIYCNVSNSTHQNPIISGNTIANYSSTATGSIARIAGILFNSSSSPIIRQNIIRNINTASTYTAISTDIALTGIMYTGSTGTALITQNTINALSVTNNTAVTNNVSGILYTASLNGNISRNQIYDLRNASTLNSPTSPPRAIGIFLYAPTTSVNIANNMIALGNGQTTNTSFGGIIAGVNSTYTLRAYHNTVYIQGTAGTGGNHTTCFDRSHFTVASNTAITVDVRNNLFMNARNGGTGIHYAIANCINATSSTSGWPATTCNNNILNAANPAAIGYWTGQRTLAAWRTSSGNCDINSYSGTPVTFVNSAVGDLHINMGTTSNDIESHGNLIAGYTNDFDGDTRPGPVGSVNGGGGAPDIGADEFDGVPNDNIPPVITYTANTCGTAGDLVFTATIADPAGVATGGLAPRVYYRKNAAAFTLANSAAGVLTSGTVLNGVWTFTVSASALGGLVAGNTVSYFVIAQDVNNFVGSNTQAGMTAASVNSISVYPTNPTTYTVGLGGTYSVGTAGNYATITSAVAAYNGASCLAGPVVFELISPTYASESFPITINNHTWANATNTLTIRPAAGVAATVTGSPATVSMFRLFNARYVTLDGVNSGGRSLTLNNTYTSTSANIMLSSSGYGSGCRNIALKNMSMNGGSNTSSGVYGIMALGNTTTPTTIVGYDNDTITIEGNTITKCYYGIFSYQTGYTTSMGGNTDWVIKNNKIGPDVYNATTNIGANGMYLYGLINPVITGNTVQNVGLTTLSLQAIGIYVPSIIYGFSIDSNKVTGITSLFSATGTSANTGIYIAGQAGNGSITRNVVQDIWCAQTGTSSARGIMLSSPGSLANILIANNMVSNIRHSGTSTSTASGAVGIALENSYGYIRLYHNTVLLDGTTGGNAATFSACFYAISGNNNVDVRNNIFVNNYNNAASATDKGYAFFTSTANSLFNQLDYNDYSVSAPNVTAYTSGDRIGLSAFQTAYGRNTNSKEVAPTFVSGSNVRLTAASGNAALASGTPLTEVPTDIDGTTRNATSPTMGGHEIALCTSITAGTVSPAVATLCGSGTTTITATGATAGESIEWRYSTDSVNWVTIAGAGSASYVIPTPITTTTWYRFVNKCSSTTLADSAVTKVEVIALPDAITGTLTYCADGTATLSSSAAAGTWSSSNTTVASVNSATGLVTANATGTATISFTLTSTGCVRTAVVTVNAMPTVSGVTAASGTVCVGGGIVLNAGTTTGTGSVQSYNWSGPSSYSTTTSAATTSRTTTTVGDGGTYSLTVTYTGAGCTSTPVTVPVTVNAVPTIGSITASSATLCAGATLTLNATGASGTGTLTSYNWTGPNAFSTTTTGASANLTVSTASSGEYSVSVSYTGTGCTSSMAKTDPDVTVNALPSLTSVTAANDVLCMGTDVSLTANGATGTGSIVSYNWSGPASYSTTTLTNSVNRTATATTHSGNYSVSVTYAGTGCTSAIVQKSVTVNALPTASGVTVASDIVCIGGDIALTAGSTSGTGSVQSYNWSGPASYSTTTSAATTSRTTTAVSDGGTYSLTVTYTGAGCTSAPVTVPVTVNAVPTIGSITASSATLCAGATLTLNAASASGSGTLLSYNWAGPNSFSATTTGASANLTVSTASSGEYSVSVTYTGTGCTSNMAKTDPDVTVNALPSLTSVTAANDVLCVGTDVSLTANGATGTGSIVSYNWSGPASYSTTTLTNSVNRTATATTHSGTYSVSVTYAGDGCTSAIVQKEVTVNALPTVSGVSVASGIVCVGGNIAFTAGSTSGTGSLQSYIWSGPSSYSTTTSAATTSRTTTAVGDGGTYSLTVTYTGAGCTSAPVTVPVTVNALPTIGGISASSATLCTGATLTLNATSASGGSTLVSYNWAGPNSFSTTTTGASANLTVSTASSGEYSVSVTYTGTGCTSSMATTNPDVTVNALPSLTSVTAANDVLCIGTDVSLTANGATGTGSIVSYNWSGPASYSTTSLTNSANRTATATTHSGTYSVSVTYAGTGCTSGAVQTDVTVNALPTLTGITATPNPICQNSVLNMTASGAAGTGTLVSYNWSGPAGYTNTSLASSQSYTVPATTASGSYSVTVTYTGAGCTSAVRNTPAVTVNPAPIAYNLTGGGTYCAGESGVPMDLSNSQIGVNYQLYDGAALIGSPVSGIGMPVSFGMQTMAGTYTVLATNTATGCTAPMDGSTFVSISTVPVIYTVTGGGTYCDGTTPPNIGVSSSDVSVSYQLYRNGVAIGSLVVGDGNPVNFGPQALSGVYSVVANPGSSCARTMTGTKTVTMHPAPSAYDVSGGGTICAGDAGEHVYLSWSVTGINYQLYRGSSAVGSPVAGAMAGLDMGVMNVAGTYTVRATNATTGCGTDMNGSATINVNPAPASQNVTGGGVACEGTNTVMVGLDGSVSGINYQLYRGAVAVGTPLAGTGSAISFGPQNVSGVYTVMATNTITTCGGGMTGSATVSINPAPVAYNVTGGGNYCAGGSGYTVGMANTNVGVFYQLYRGSVTVGGPVPGTGAAISFGTFTASGTYTVLATNMLTSCSAAMNGSAVIGINPNPSVYSVTGGGAYCTGGSGVPVGLSFSSSAINYQLYNGSSMVGAAIPGNGSTLSFGNQLAAGTYTVRATNPVTGCAIDMTGSAVVVQNPLPALVTVTGGGSYCAGNGGMPVGVNSSQTGISYQLYRGSVPVGSALLGNGSALSYGNQTTDGVYTVMATNTATTCARGMTGSATIITNPLPPQYAVAGGGSYCAGGSGVEITLNGSDNGITYQLYNGSTAIGTPVAGNGFAISFGLHTLIGTYSVTATNTTTACAGNMFGSVAVVSNPLPIAYNVTGGGAACAGSTGVAVGLANSTTGVSYQLYNGATPMGGAVAGTGAAISFGNQTVTGTYTVLATNLSTLCTNAMSGNAGVTINALPAQYNVSGGGTYCENGSGVNVSLVGSQSGINYQLYNSSTAMGSPVAGTGAAISFGSQTLAGTYTVLATDATTGCTRAMTSSAAVVMSPAPVAHNVTGGGGYCIGGSGVNIGLNNSTIGISYQLYRGATAVGGVVAGTGDAINFGLQTVAGTYTVLATNTVTTCTNAMNGNAVVVINPLPVAYNISGGGGYCIGGTGVAVGVANTQTGVNYQLYRGTSAVGAPVAGTGAAISFGLQTVAGNYTVQATNATTGCVRGMNGYATVTINPLPVIYNVTGGGVYCAGGPGSHIGVELSEPGVNYQLYLGASAIGTPVTGSGAGVDFGEVFVVGTYSVVATNAATGCIWPMAGSATVGVSTPPVAYNVTGGGSFCAGGAGINVGLSNSATGISYTLYRGTSVVGLPIAGTGSALSFGPQTVAGSYSVRATNSSGCATDMTGTATIIVNPVPASFAVTGGGSYCPGAGGVNIGLTGSAIGVSYQLYIGSTPVGSPITGTGAVLAMGTYTTVGTYSAVATASVSGCTNNMSGTASVSQYTLPAVYSMTGGGNYCSGGSGVSVGLSGSQTGVSYTLYRGASVVGTYAGTGSALNFGVQTIAASYSVSATNTTTGCASNMTGASVVGINTLPAVYLTTGGGNYCAGGAGFAIILNGSNTGINYELYRNGTATGSMLAGTGTYIDFGLQTVAGMYTVKATNATTGCIRTMAGSPEVIVHSLPVAHNVAGGGSYCAGGSGVEISLANSSAGVSYQLYNGSTPIGTAVAGTGSVLSLGMQTAAGTYTVQALNAATGCTNAMAGSATVSILALPNAFAVTGGGGYCAGGNGVAVGLANTQSGVSYQLYRNGVAVGTALSGTGAAISFGLQSAAGSYTVRATAGSGCANNMAGAVTVNVNPAPVVFTTGGGGSYCVGSAGVAVNVNGSETGVNYMLYNGSTATGALVAGTGGLVTFGPQTAGSYSVMAVNLATSCTSAMTGVVSVTANPLPVAWTVMGGGTLCAGASGVSITLSGSDMNVSYALYNGTAATGTTVSGTGAILNFGLFANAGEYSVQATDMLTGCTNNMNSTATVSVNPAPVQYTMTGGGNYCPGGAGVVVGLSGSQSGITYQLYRNGVATGATVSGTGGAVSFAAQTLAGNYTATAVDGATGCNNAMTGAVTVGLHAAPVAHTVTGGGSYCAGGAGVSIALNGSSFGITYRLYNGATPVGSAIAGTGAAINFGMQSAPGTYTVLATNPTTGCTRPMNSSATVVVNALPAVAAVTGGGAYCAGGIGVAVGVAATQIGVSYRLYKGTVAVGTAVAGTGVAISFGNISVAGTYTVAAANATTGCAASMSGSAIVNINNLPAVQNVTGGGNYCAGTAGAEVALSGSELGINYQLYNGSSAVGAAVAGTGNILSLGTQSATGTYTVLATNTATGCTRVMSGSVPVTVSALPVAQTVSGGGAYCAGGNGVAITLGGSQTGVTYKLYRGATLVQTVSGTGSALNMGLQTVAGMYTAMAVNTATSCTASMAGSASVTVSPLPVAQSVGGGGSYCAGTAGAVVTLAGSETGIIYTLYNNSGVAVATAAGSGEGISFGAQVTGSYSVRATNPVSGCTANMLSTANVTMNTLPVAYTVTGGGGYCEGGTGVPVALGNSQLGVTYELYQNGIATGNIKNGSGASLTFGSQPVGVYSVVATSVATGCQRTMTGAATVYNYVQPLAFNVLGGGSYCAGGAGLAVTLSGSQAGISYRLYRGALALGSAMAGNGSTLNFGMQTVSGDYTIKATNNLTGCVATMTGIASVSINELPQAYNMTGGGSYCAGGSGVVVGLASSDEGISYQLYSGTTAMGDALHGNNSALDFGNQTTAGNYRIIATNDVTGCTSAMATTVAVSVNAVPQVYTLSASAAGYCVGSNGVQITLNNSQTGVAYHLYNGATASGGAVNGTNGNGISFGFQTATGTYSVMAVNNTTGCTSVMSGTPSVTVFELPSVYAITGGGSYCAGTDGMPVGLIGTQSGVNYQLYRGGVAVGSPLSGSGSGITFGTQPAGIYTVRAQNAATGCRNNMTGTANVEMNALPVAHNVTGGGTYCEGGAGLTIGLSNTQAGISYQLFNGTTAAGLSVTGTTTAINFGLQTAAGSYWVKATDLATGCATTMNGTATININAAPEVASVTGGGALCVGSAGVSINLTGSATGISYRLHNGTSAVGTATAGTGGAISFTNVTAAGTYSVIATSVANGCSKAMSGTATVVVNALPAVANVTGGGSYCAGADGVAVGLDASVNGINYTLYQGSTAVAMVSGTGSAISYGIHTGAGSYTVLATDAATGCTRNMAGSATISITPAVIPVVALTSSASGAVCEGTLVTFTTTQTNGGATPAYTWQVNGTTMPSSTSTFSYIPANNDIVTVAMASNALCAIPSVATATQTMVVNAKVSPVVHATVSVAGDTVCAGVPVTFTAIPEFGGTAPVFEWVKNGSVTATGAEFTFVPANGDVVHVRMVSNYECVLSGLANSEMTTLSVLAPQAPVVTVVANPGTVVAKGQTVTFTVNAANTYQPAYQWFVNGVAVHNATSATYTTAQLEDNDTVACRVTNVTPCGEYVATGKVRMSVNEVGVQTVSAGLDVRVMPNPTRGNLVITGSIATAYNNQLHVEVTNMLGQIVYRSVADVRNGRVEATLNLSGELANGMYLLNLRTETETKVFHITLQR